VCVCVRARRTVVAWDNKYGVYSSCWRVCVCVCVCVFFYLFSFSYTLATGPSSTIENGEKKKRVAWTKRRVNPRAWTEDNERRVIRLYNIWSYIYTYRRTSIKTSSPLLGETIRSVYVVVVVLQHLHRTGSFVQVFHAIYYYKSASYSYLRIGLLIFELNRHHRSRIL